MKGSLPLLKIVKGRDLSTFSVEVVPSQTDTTWVAVSHVWADGLGNPRRNALPRCQLLHLNAMVQALAAQATSGHDSPTALLWLDTLCCPVSPEHAKHRALLEMKRTYQQATLVLVVDSFIQLYDSSTLDTEELWCKILLSGWMRRLWTLQEGGLGVARRRLWFQFKDKPMNFRLLRHALVKTYSTNLRRRLLAIDIMSRIAIFTAYSSQDPTDPGVDLAFVDDAMQFRSVSVGNDEPLLLGNLLDLPTAEILNGPIETRMDRVWSLMPSALRGIPKSIIFRLCPRLSREGFRWAPATMMHSDPANKNPILIWDEDKEGIPTQQGLLVKLAGYTVTMPERPKGLPPNPWNLLNPQKDQALYVRDTEGLWYLLIRRLASTETDFLSNMRLEDYIRSNSGVWVVHLETDFQLRSDGDTQASTGLLVKLVKEEGSIKYVRSEMHVQAKLLPNTYQEIFEAAHLSATILLQGSLARQLSDISRQLESSQADVTPDAVLGAIGSEIHRIATADPNDGDDASAVQRASAQNSALFEHMTATFFIGHYGIITPKLAGDQQWCID